MRFGEDETNVTLSEGTTQCPRVAKGKGGIISHLGKGTWTWHLACLDEARRADAWARVELQLQLAASPVLPLEALTGLGLCLLAYNQKPW